MASEIPQKQLLTLSDLRNSYGIDKSRVSIWRWEKAGRFPKRVGLQFCCDLLRAAQEKVMTTFQVPQKNIVFLRQQFADLQLSF